MGRLLHVFYHVPVRCRVAIRALMSRTEHLVVNIQDPTGHRTGTQRKYLYPTVRGAMSPRVCPGRILGSHQLCLRRYVALDINDVATERSEYTLCVERSQIHSTFPLQSCSLGQVFVATCLRYWLRLPFHHHPHEILPRNRQTMWDEDKQVPAVNSDARPTYVRWSYYNSSYLEHGTGSEGNRRTDPVRV